MAITDAVISVTRSNEIGSVPQDWLCHPETPPSFGDRSKSHSLTFVFLFNPI